MKVLLSIKPEFAERIFSGQKKFEFRKALFKDRSVRVIVVYATQPVKKIIGEFRVEDIIGGAPDEIWDKTSEWAGISHEFFENYFSGRRRAYAIKVGETFRYEEPLDPNDVIANFCPPQSYMYVDDTLQRMERDPDQRSLF